MRNIKFTDSVDASAVISLYEYGLIRNPITGKTLVCMNTNGDVHAIENKPDIRVTHIDIDEVREKLEEVSDGYFGFIGSDKDTELKGLDNEHLTSHIMSLNMWDGFLDQMF